jgi:hypothetical protein
MPANLPLVSARYLMALAWMASELFAFGLLWAAEWLRGEWSQLLCTLAGPLACVTAISRFQHHSALSNTLFVLVFVLLTALPFLYVWRPRRWTLIVSMLAWGLWPWLGVLFTINRQ